MERPYRNYFFASMLVGMLIGPDMLYSFLRGRPSLFFLSLAVELRFGWIFIVMAILPIILSFYVYRFRPRCILHMLYGLVLGPLIITATFIATLWIASYSAFSMHGVTEEAAGAVFIESFLIVPLLVAPLFIIVFLWATISTLKDCRTLRFSRNASPN